MASTLPSLPRPTLRATARGAAAGFGCFALLTGYCLARSYAETCCVSLAVSTRWGASATIAWGGWAALLWSRRAQLRKALTEGIRMQFLLFLVLCLVSILADLLSFRIAGLAGGHVQSGREMMERLVAFAPRAAMLAALVMLSLVVWQHRQALRTAPRPLDAWLAFPEAPLLRLRASEISLIQSAGNYSELVTPGGTHLVRIPISQLAERLDPSGFVRVHRRTMVNIRHVRAVRRDRSGRPVIQLGCGATVPVGRRYAASIERVAATRH